jgi:hypothetical protein
MSPRGLAAVAGLILAGTLALGGLAAPGEHAAGGWRGLPGFDFAFGVVGCVAIVLVSKALGRLGLQKPEGWDAPAEEDEP